MDFHRGVSPASVGWHSLQLPPGKYHDRVSEGELDWWAKVWIGRHVSDSIAELMAERDRLKREVATYRSDKFGWQLDAKSVQVDQHLLQIAEELLKLKQSPPVTLAPPKAPVHKPPRPGKPKNPDAAQPQRPHSAPAKVAPGQQDAIKRLHDGIVQAYENDPLVKEIKNLQDAAVGARGKLADLAKQVRNQQGRRVSDEEVRNTIGEVLSALHEIAKKSAEVEGKLNVDTGGDNDWFWKRMGVNQSTGLADIADAAAAVNDRNVEEYEKKYGVDGDQPSQPTTRDQRRADLEKVYGTQKQLQEFGHDQYKGAQRLTAAVVKDDREDFEKEVAEMVMRLEADPYSVRPAEIQLLMMHITTGARGTQNGGIPYINPQEAAKLLTDALNKRKMAAQEASP